MDYLEFKKALRAIGEAEQAAEYFRITQSIHKKIKEFIIHPPKSPEPIVKQKISDSELEKIIKMAKDGDSYFGEILNANDETPYQRKQRFFVEIDESFDKIRIQPNKVKPILCSEILKNARIYEFDKKLSVVFSYLPDWELDFIKTELAEIENQANQEPATPPPATKINPQKQIPDLSEIFKRPDYFEMVIKHLENDELISFDRETGRYQWQHTKALLAGLAYRLREKNRLNNDFDIYNPQFLGRAFCKFFNLEHDAKTFLPERVKQEHREPFKWITDFTENNKV